MSAEPRGTIRRKTQTRLLYSEESYLIRGACFAVYSRLRNSQKESIYQRSLAEELKTHNFLVEREKQLPIFYKGKKVGVYTPDIIVNELIVIELKAKPVILKNDLQQFWYYLKNSQFRLGFLVNFGEPHGVRIIRRVYDTSRISA